MDAFFKDLRYGARLLAKGPGLTFVAVLSLALGIGANTAIFSLVDKVLLRPLPVAHPEQLVTVLGHNDRGINSSFSYLNYKDLRDQNDVLAGLIATAQAPLSMSEGGQSERIYGSLVSGNYFDVLGVKAQIGRTFLPDEDATAGASPVVVLSYGLWQRRFGGDLGILNHPISLNGHEFTIIGVGPRDFTGTDLGSIPDVYLPMMMQAAAMPKWKGALDSPNMSWLDLMGRLKPEVSREQAQAALTTISSQLAAINPDAVDPEIVLESARRGNVSAVSDLSTPLWLLLSTVALVLIIACANIANLLLARATGRAKEIAVRLAVGASRWRLIRQLLTEAVMLSVLGGTLGLLVAIWVIDLLLSFKPSATSFFLPAVEVRLDGRVLAFTLLLSIATGVIFGLAPALQASRADLVDVLKDESGAASGGRRAVIRNVLVIAQIALSVVVLISAGLCLKSLDKLNSIDAGFDTEKVLVAPVDLALNGYQEAAGRQFYSSLLDRISALPGVDSLSLARIVPLGGGGMRITLHVEGYTPQPGEIPTFDFNIVSPDYVKTMRMALIRGREFTPGDTKASKDVVVINEAVARGYFGDQDPIGKHIILDGVMKEPARPLEIVGIVRDSKYRSLTEGSRPSMYLPHLQHYFPDLALHLRTLGDPAALVAAVRNEVRSLDPNLPVVGIRTLAEQKGSSLFRERMAAIFLSAFGVLALLLAAIGIYGVMAFAVSRRTREIGIRMALGASGNDVMRLMLRQGGMLVGLGVATGISVAFFAASLLDSFLYGVTAKDLTTFVVVPLLLTGVALAACFLPARRATKVDPMVALRYE